MWDYFHSAAGGDQRSRSLPRVLRFSFFLSGLISVDGSGGSWTQEAGLSIGGAISMKGAVRRHSASALSLKGAGSENAHYENQPGPAVEKPLIRLFSNIAKPVWRTVSM